MVEAHSFICLHAELHEGIGLARPFFEYCRFASAGTPPPTGERQLLKLTKYAKHYKELVAGAGSSPVAKLGCRIAPYYITKLHPPPLMIPAWSIREETKNELFPNSVSCLVRRAACGLTHKNYNNVFVETVPQLHSDGVKLAALRPMLGGLTGEASRWPQDGEFKAPACQNGCTTADWQRSR